MELKRQHEWKEKEEEENASHEAAENTGRGGRTQGAVAVEIPRRIKVSMRLVTREEQDGDLGMRDAGAVKETVVLATSQHATIEGSDNIF